MADPADSGIYEIVNLVNGKRYVGSAVDMAHRWREHRWSLNGNRHSNRHLQASWAKHGDGAFAFNILETCGPADLIAREQVAIDLLRPEFNICPRAGSTLGRRHTSETKAKIAVQRKGRKLPPRSPEHRAKLAAAMKGRPKPADQMAALQAGRREQEFTEERRARVSTSLKAAYVEGRKSRTRPPEYREKIAASLRGRKASPEHRANQSAAQLGKKRGPYRRHVAE